MTQRDSQSVERIAARLRGDAARAWAVMRRQGPSQAQFWLIALLIGTAAGFAALGFRIGISALQTALYGTDDMRLASVARTLPWYWVLAVPVLGGLVVGVILHRFTPDGRVRAVADVIEGAALNRGRVEVKAGLASALASLVTLSSGGSSGREGPVVHLAGVISTWVADRINASGMTGRDLLGCAVAGAVSASFNAPIAGTLFALEVVLRHFAVHAFAPIAIAAVAGTVINRLKFGDVTEFTLPADAGLAFYVELPAFLILGLVSGLVAVTLMKAIFWAEDVASAVQARTGLPRWLRPAVAGLLLGLLAIPFPHIIGVGYETTTRALTGGLGAIVSTCDETYAANTEHCPHPKPGGGRDEHRTTPGGDHGDSSVAMSTSPSYGGAALNVPPTANAGPSSNPNMAWSTLLVGLSMSSNAEELGANFRIRPPIPLT